MSGPWAEEAPLHIRTGANTALWPLLLWRVHTEAQVHCVFCGGQVLVGRLDGRPFSLADLTARVEKHAAECPAMRGGSGGGDQREGA